MAPLTAGLPLSDSPSGPDSASTLPSFSPHRLWTFRHPRYFNISSASTSHCSYLTGCFQDKSGLLWLLVFVMSKGRIRTDKLVAEMLKNRSDMVRNISIEKTYFKENVEANNTNSTQAVGCNHCSSSFVKWDAATICNLCASGACEALLVNGTLLACLQPAWSSDSLLFVTPLDSLPISLFWWFHYLTQMRKTTSML